RKMNVTCGEGEEKVDGMCVAVEPAAVQPETEELPETTTGETTPDPSEDTSGESGTPSEGDKVNTETSVQPAPDTDTLGKGGNNELNVIPPSGLSKGGDQATSSVECTTADKKSQYLTCLMTKGTAHSVCEKAQGCYVKLSEAECNRTKSDYNSAFRCPIDYEK
ncbi:MAG: hypothetical protein OXC40_05030, partial [Proteobacteria bacterium]|nr:hypothetical protein [Pseudomonadota bacterium]